MTLTAPGFLGPFISMSACDPATGDTLATHVGQSRRIAGPFRAPASGQFKIAVFEPSGWFRNCYDATCGGIYHFGGPYGFHVIAVNRAPENGPAAYTVGDTVRGETISPVGDIDEFTSSGVLGEQLRPFDRLTATSPLDSAIILEVIDPGTGTSLAGSNTAVFFLPSRLVHGPGERDVHCARTYLRRIRPRCGHHILRVFVKRGP